MLGETRGQVLVRRQGEQKSVSRARAHVVGGGTFHTSSVVVFTSWDTDAETEKRVTPDSLPEALGETDASRQISRTTRALDKLMLGWASEEEEDAGVGKRRRWRKRVRAHALLLNASRLSALSLMGRVLRA